MKLWLTKQRNGTYMLTKLKPIKCRVYGTEHEDVYVQYGEPIGLRHLCDVIAQLAQITSLEALQSIQVNLTVQQITQALNPS